MNVEINPVSATLTLTPIEKSEQDNLQTLVKITNLGGDPHIVHDDGFCYIYVIAYGAKAGKTNYCCGIKIPIIATTPFDMSNLREIRAGRYGKFLRLTLRKGVLNTWHLCIK